MGLGTLVGVTARSAAQLCQHFELGNEARALLLDELAPRPFLEQLVDADYHDDAVRFLAHALPEREAVWWGCLCLGYALHLGPESEVPPAVDAAVRWVVDPSEQNRCAAESPGEAAQLGTPLGWLAMAAFWSAGSTHLPKNRDTSPSAFRTAKAVADGIITLAAALPPSSEAVNRLREFLALGIEVANGRCSWESSLPQPGIVEARSTDTVGEMSPEPGTRFPKEVGERRFGDRRSESGRWS